MTITPANIKMWSRVGSRAAFGLTAMDLGKEFDDLMMLTGDTSTSAGLDRFKKTYPEKFLDVGIAEQNMMGIAAGLASEGYKVFTATFAPFQTMRCCEQIKVNLGYMNHKVCMVGLASGVVLGTLGYSHCCIEDVSIMRSIPNITIVSPADCTETVKAAHAAVHWGRPIYLRLTGGAKNPPVYDEDYGFEIGKAQILRKGKDVALIAAGTMVYQALQAAERLAEEGIEASVINMHTIKPLDTEAVRNVCETSKLLVTVEEHNVVGGLGGAVAEYKSTLKTSPPQIFLGLPDHYDKAGDYNDILTRHGLIGASIAERVAFTFRTLM